MSPTPGAAPTIRPLVVLTADLAEAAVRWRRLGTIPFGPERSQLGRELPPVHTAVPLMPRSFTVGRDGTLWILDAVKQRVAHYRGDGTYLGDARGLAFDRFHPLPRDLAFWGGRLFVLHQFHLAASFREARGGGFGPPLPLEWDGQPLVMSTVFPGPRPLGLADGVAALERLGSGPRGIGRIVPGNPSSFQPTDGLPVGDGVSVALDAYRAQAFHLVTTGPAGRVVQPIRLRAEAGGHPLPATFVDRVQGGGAGALVVWLRGAPTRPGDAARSGGGNWLLRYPTDGSPLVFERLPEPAVADGYQTRHLSVDPRGRIYLMLTERHGMAIFRR
jgi:hypothetical protein